MSWLVFAYSLPARKNSSTRVSLWRRLRRVGAAALKGGVFILPDREDCLDSFYWLAQEIQESKGEAVLMKVESFEKLSDHQIIESFHSARKKDYDELRLEIRALEKETAKIRVPKCRDRLEKLRKRFTKINEIDFFRSPYAGEVKDLLSKAEARLYSTGNGASPNGALRIRDYKGKAWVTRPRPYIDRLACVWLIRRFIDSKAAIRYSDIPGKNELPFDMKEAVFGHCGNLCSFEVMLRSFGIQDEGANALAEIIHEIDLRDNKYRRPEAEGVELALKGWRRLELTDAEMEARGLLLFDGLHKALAGGEKI